MERSGDEEQVGSGYELNPVITTGAPAIPTSSDESLPGSNGRWVTGAFQILCGAIEIALGIVVICVPLQKYSFTYVYGIRISYVYDADVTDDVGWGIWNGLLAILAGCLGLRSRKTKWVVVAYLILSTVATVSSVLCIIWAATSIPIANEDAESYVDGNHSVSFAMYIALSIAFGVQVAISILGASFTCGALLSTNNQHQAVYYYGGQPQHQQTGPIHFSLQPPELPPQYATACNASTQSTTNGDDVKPSL